MITLTISLTDISSLCTILMFAMELIKYKKN